MKPIKLWEQYTEQYPMYNNSTYEAWCYGSDMPDVLAELTLKGIKTATASAYPFYVVEDCALPKIGDHYIILNTKDEALCIIRTTHVNVVPFHDVSAQHAYNEGEGDRSLSFWRNVHESAFRKELIDINIEFSEDMLVVCEEFEVVFVAK